MFVLFLFEWQCKEVAEVTHESGYNVVFLMNISKLKE